MLNEGRKVHDLLEDHPVDHLDVVVPHQARGAGGGEAGVGHLPSHAGVHHTGWGLYRVLYRVSYRVLYRVLYRVGVRLVLATWPCMRVFITRAGVVRGHGHVFNG